MNTIKQNYRDQISLFKASIQISTHNTAQRQLHSKQQQQKHTTLAKQSLHTHRVNNNTMYSHFKVSIRLQL